MSALEVNDLARSDPKPNRSQHNCVGANAAFYTGANVKDGVTVHEFGHSFRDLSSTQLHDDASHSSAPDDDCAGRVAGFDEDLCEHFCPKHVLMMRQNAARKTGNHDETSFTQDPTEWDSN